MNDAFSGSETLDREQAFLLYCTFCGDLEKTAAAVGVRAVDILRAVDEEGWNERLKPILEMKKSTRPGDFERAINRALNFSQCHRMRLFLERVVVRITGMTPEELESYLLTDHAPKSGEAYKKLSTRALADLATALEKVQAMTYQALADTAQDRAKRKEAEESGESGGELHARIAEAMSKVGKIKTVRGQLLDAQIEASQLQTPSVNVYDKDS